MEYEKEEPIKTQCFPDGTVVKAYADGTIVQTTKTTSLVRFPCGRRVQTDKRTGICIESFPDGSKVQKHGDGSEIRLQPDGTKVQISAAGIKTTAYPDGSITQMQKDGTLIKLFPDGSKQQQTPDGRSLHRQNSCEDLKSLAIDKACQGGSVVQTLRILSDGSLYQVNKAGPWRVIVKDGATGRVVQRRQDDSIMVTQSGKPEDAVLFESPFPKDKPQELLDAERLCNDAFDLCRQQLPADMEQRLVDAEVALLTSSKDCEKKLFSMKERMQEEKQRALKLKQQYTAEKLQHAGTKVQLSNLRADKDNLQKELTLLKKKPKTSEMSTQWDLRDAQSQFFQRKITEEKKAESEEMFADPQMVRIVIDELRTRIMNLECEKQEVEDRLIDLRFSLSSAEWSGQKAKRSGFVRWLISGGWRGSPKSPDRGVLTRKESLVEAISNLKLREQQASDLLLGKKNETAHLTSENRQLMLELDRTSKERDEALARCKELDEALARACELDSHPFDESTNCDTMSANCHGNGRSSRSSSDSELDMLPCIEEELQMHIKLSPFALVSPMI